MRPTMVRESTAIRPPSQPTSELSKCCTCLTWTLIGALLVGVVLACLLTLLIREQSISTSATLCTTTTMTTSTVASAIQKREVYICGNTSSYRLWSLFSTDGLTMTIDTTMCHFNSTPLYFTSMAGRSFHWLLTSYDAIYNPTQNNFAVCIRSIYYPNNTQLSTAAQTNQWNVNWYGLLQ